MVSFIQVGIGLLNVPIKKWISCWRFPSSRGPESQFRNISLLINYLNHFVR